MPRPLTKAARSRPPRWLPALPSTRGESAITAIATVASTAGPSAIASATSPASSPDASPSPAKTTAAKLTELVSRKKATVRRPTRSAGIPIRFSAQAPSARPPAPPVGRSTLAACSAIATS